jgi:putative RecB family exonuclease
MPLWSHSRIGAFEQCPKRYFFRYVEKPDVDKIDSIEAFLGSRVHDSLEQLYRDVRMHKDVTLQELLDEFEKGWQKHYHDGIKIVRRRYTAENYFKVGQRCLQDYYRRHHPFSQSRTLGLEERIVIDLDMHGEYKLQGYIDRLSQAGDGHYEIHDYKTSNSLPMQQHFEEDRQLALYQIGVERRFGDARRVDLVWHYLQFDRELRSQREPEALDQLRYDTIGAIQSIEAQSEKGDFPTRESALCDWCEFYSICPAKKHLFQLQELPPNEYRDNDGVKLVEEWVRLTAEKKEVERRVDAEMGRLREAVIAYAEHNELEVIAGVENKLRVKLRHGLKVPAVADDPIKVQALKSKLQAMGVWDDVSQLNRFALDRLLDGDELTIEQKRLLQSEMIPDLGARITVSRLSERDRLLED